jgi:hypothetical protein
MTALELSKRPYPLVRESNKTPAKKREATSEYSRSGANSRPRETYGCWAEFFALGSVTTRMGRLSYDIFAREVRGISWGMVASTTVRRNEIRHGDYSRLARQESIARTDAHE